MVRKLIIACLMLMLTLPSNVQRSTFNVHAPAYAQAQEECPHADDYLRRRRSILYAAETFHNLHDSTDYQVPDAQMMTFILGLATYQLAKTPVCEALSDLQALTLQSLGVMTIKVSCLGNEDCLYIVTTYMALISPQKERLLREWYIKTGLTEDELNIWPGDVEWRILYAQYATYLPSVNLPFPIPTPVPFVPGQNA